MAQIAVTAQAEINRETLDESIRAACRWMIDKAMIKTAHCPLVDSSFRFIDRYPDWRGAFRGEYSAARQRWDVFCPVWHGGQGVKALALAYERFGDPEYLDAARRAAAFILRSQIDDADHPEFGFIRAHETGDPHVSCSAILESLDGLFELGRVSNDPRYTDAAVHAARWVQRRLFQPDEGLFFDEYDLERRATIVPEWMDRRLFPQSGRPLLDDGVFVTAYRETGDESLKNVAVRVAERLLADESPAGNWRAYPPCRPDTGIIHPRHAYWWGRPMWMVHQVTGDKRFLECCRRSAGWYAAAMRIDGGLFRDTGPQFQTRSFGHATSGVACAAILWIELIKQYGQEEWREPLMRAMSFGRSMQFRDARDPNLEGAILEKVQPPNGSDAPPWYLRDVGTFFFVQAACLMLRDLPDGV